VNALAVVFEVGAMRVVEEASHHMVAEEEGSESKWV